jgi:GntR family transcriptional repressor for pyruvate dehydrogenase complex
VCDTDPRDIDSVRKWFKESVVKLEDFTEVRGVLEVLAVRMAIERCTDDEIQKLEEINRAYIEAVQDNSVSGTTQADEEFHGQIIAMTRNGLLINLNKLVAAEFKKYRMMSFSIEANRWSAVDPHAKIMMAIKRRDATDGVTQMRYHLNLIKTDMEKIVDAQDDK